MLDAQLAVAAISIEMRKGSAIVPLWMIVAINRRSALIFAWPQLTEQPARRPFDVARE
jgi:hypothetical protein